MWLLSPGCSTPDRPATAQRQLSKLQVCKSEMALHLQDGNQNCPGWGWGEIDSSSDTLSLPLVLYLVISQPLAASLLQCIGASTLQRQKGNGLGETIQVLGEQIQVSSLSFCIHKDWRGCCEVTCAKVLALRCGQGFLAACQGF